MKNKKCGIYVIECCIEDKEYIYIGKSIDIIKRWNEHIYELTKNKHKNAIMQRLFNKYGKEVFHFFIIKECLEEELNKEEIFFINEYRKNKKYFSMNMTDGGDGGNTYKFLSEEKMEKIKKKKSVWCKENHYISEEGLKRISIANSCEKSEEAKNNMKKSWTKERRQDLSKKMIGENNPMYNVRRFGELNPMYGKVGELSPRYGIKHTEETKKKISEKRIGKFIGKDNPNYGKHLSENSKKIISEKNSKEILCLDLDYNIIGTYKNNKDCIAFFNKNYYSYFNYNKNIKNILDLKVCKKENLIFIYKEDYIRIVKGGDN